MTTEENNARSVVEMWRRGDHEPHWDAVGKGKLPSEVMQAAADAAQRVAVEADTQADLLRIRFGFQPSHEEITTLQGTASFYMQRAHRLGKWAHNLRNAERDIPPTESETP